MIFVALTPKGSDSILGSVFVRNSGTEEKTGVNVRGPKELTGALDAVGDLTRRRLLTSLKSSRSAYAKAEAMLLAELLKREAEGESLSAGEAANRLADESPGVIPERLLLEMCNQELISVESPSKPSAVIRLTPLGRWYITRG